MNRNLIFITLVLTLFFPGALFAQEGGAAIPLEAQIDVLTPSQGEQSVTVLVTLHNRDKSSPLTDVEIRTRDGRLVKLSATESNLNSGQSQALKLEIPTAPDQTYLFISYKWNSEVHSIAKAINIQRASQNVLLPTVMTAAVSFLGVIIGALLLHMFTVRRERENFRREWGKAQFEKYEKAYRDFLNDWNEDPNAHILKTQMSQLRANSPVPLTIVADYNLTYAMLSDSKATPEQKQEACKKLRHAVEQFLVQPWSV